MRERPLGSHATSIEYVDKGAGKYDEVQTAVREVNLEDLIANVSVRIAELQRYIASSTEELAALKTQQNDLILKRG